MMRIVRTAAGILALFWMCVIFAFSAQEQEESSAVSESFSYRMVCSADSFLGLNWDDERLHEIADAIEGYVRKAAHMTEYAVLACIFLANAVQYPRWKKRAYLWGWLGATVYAATDEFHQLFIEGRSGEFKDVCIDSLGACIGLLAARCAIWIWGKIFYRKR